MACSPCTRWIPRPRIIVAWHTSEAFSFVYDVDPPTCCDMLYLVISDNAPRVFGAKHGNFAFSSSNKPAIPLPSYCPKTWRASGLILHGILYIWASAVDSLLRRLLYDRSCLMGYTSLSLSYIACAIPRIRTSFALCSPFEDSLKRRPQDASRGTKTGMIRGQTLKLTKLHVETRGRGTDPAQDERLFPFPYANVWHPAAGRVLSYLFQSDSWWKTISEGHSSSLCQPKNGAALSSLCFRRSPISTLGPTYLYAADYNAAAGNVFIRYDS